MPKENIHYKKMDFYDRIKKEVKDNENPLITKLVENAVNGNFIYIPVNLVDEVKAAITLEAFNSVRKVVFLDKEDLEKGTIMLKAYFTPKLIPNAK